MIGAASVSSSDSHHTQLLLQPFCIFHVNIVAFDSVFLHSEVAASVGSSPPPRRGSESGNETCRKPDLTATAVQLWL